MIYATVNVTIGDYRSTCDNTIVLYRGDKNVEIRFVLKGNKFTVLNSIYAQMIITRPSATSVFSEIAPIQNDTVILTISEDMIDELTEVGCYDMQIRLYDDSMKSRVTIPPAEKAIEVREPIAIDESFVDTAMVGYARARADSGDEEDKRFDENGNYIKTHWEHGDIITAGKLNKVEDSLEAINANDIQNHIEVNEKIDALVESIDAAEYITETELNAKGYLTEHQDISGKADKTELPTKTSQLTNDSGFLTQIPNEYVTETELNAKGYLTEHQDISGKADKTEIPTKTSQLTNDSGFLNQVPSEYITETELNAKGYLTEHQDISGKADKTELHNHSNKSVLDDITSSKVTEWDNKSTFSGNYNDLTNKPIIPSIEGLATEEYVDEKLEDIDIKGNCKVAYGTCSTEAATAEKTVVVEDTNWELEVGSMVTIRFSVTNSASNVTINVNGTGAYPIWASAAEYTSTSSNYTGYANRTYTYMFNGTHWVWMSNGVYPSSTTNASLGHGYGVCSTAEATLAKACTISSYTLSTGGSVSVKFTNAVPANSTLNIRTRGDKKIFYQGAAISDGVIKAGDTATFVYDGTQYQLISIDSPTFNGDYNSLTNKPTIPTKTSQLTNDSGFLTQIPNEYVTETELNAKGYLTEHQDISNKVDKVSGKGLSTNDYTTAEKDKLAGIATGATAVKVWLAKECTTYTSDDVTSTCTPAAVKKAVGMFDPKSHTHSQYLTAHQDISGKADKTEIPTKTSQLTNDSNFITKHQGSENAGKILAVDNNGDIVFEEMPEGSGEGGTKSESLEFTYTTSYPNQTTFAYTTTAGPATYWLYKKSTLLGGILSVDWDTALLTSVELILYLFDSDGNPYKYTQRYQSNGFNETISGDKYTVVWMDPGTSSGFCIATGPFTIKIPDNCSVMISMRGTNAVFPSGSTLNSSNFYKLVSSVVYASVIKEASAAFAKVDVIQGAANANRIMITNDKGEVVVGDINPNSMALRPNWDTVIHRGWINGAKENTIPAFYLAKENGYSWVECDIRISSDGIPVLAHDATITSEDGTSVLTVAESTVSQLQSITLQNHERFGAIKMNTLAELLDMARCLGMKIVLDIKVSGESAMKSIAKTVLRYGMSDNVIYMPIGATNASYIKVIDKNASFDFVMYGTSPTSATDLTEYASLLNGSNRVNLDIQANTWEFTPTVIDAINNAGLGLCAWNVMSDNIGKCIDSGMLRITKHNNFDDVDLNADYLKDKKFW